MATHQLLPNILLINNDMITAGDIVEFYPTDLHQFVKLHLFNLHIFNLHILI